MGVLKKLGGGRGVEDLSVMPIDCNKLNYLQRETQTRPVFKTYRMDATYGISLASERTSVTSLVTIPNFKWPADRWRSSPGNARMKYKGVPISMQNTQVIESWKPKTPQEVPRSKKDENINQIYDCEESERKSEIQTTRPTTKYEEKRTRPEDCIRVNTALPGRRRLLVSRQGHNPDKFIFDNSMSRGQCPTGSASPRAPSRFIVRRHSLSK